jgi:hypothetical protein
MNPLRLTIAALIFLPITAQATVDYLAVNTITKEYYWGDEDHSTGWIGWKFVPEAQLETAEADLKKLGYTRTYYPYKIESLFVSLVVILTLGQYVVRRKLKKNKINKLA